MLGALLPLMIDAALLQLLLLCRLYCVDQDRLIWCRRYACGLLLLLGMGLFWQPLLQDNSHAQQEVT